MTRRTLSRLLIVLFDLECRWLLGVFGCEFFQFGLLLGEEALRPHDNIIEFASRDEHVVKAAQVLRVLIHDSEHPHAVALDLFNGVTEESQILQVLQGLQLPRLFQVCNVVSMQIKCLQGGEAQQFVVNLLKEVV